MSSSSTSTSSSNEFYVEGEVVGDSRPTRCMYNLPIKKFLTINKSLR